MTIRAHDREVLKFRFHDFLEVGEGLAMVNFAKILGIRMVKLCEAKAASLTGESAVLGQDPCLLLAGEAAIALTPEVLNPLLVTLGVPADTTK